MNLLEIESHSPPKTVSKVHLTRAKTNHAANFLSFNGWKPSSLKYHSDRNINTFDSIHMKYF